MLSAFTNSLKIPELRQRIFFTIALIFVCRLVAVIPTPGVDAATLQAIMDRMAAQGGDIGVHGAAGSVQRRRPDALRRSARWASCPTSAPRSSCSC